MAEAYQPRLKKHFEEVVVKDLTEKFGYSNRMQVPRLEKIVLNMGVGEAVNKVVGGPDTLHGRGQCFGLEGIPLDHFNLVAPGTALQAGGFSNQTPHAIAGFQQSGQQPPPDVARSAREQHELAGTRARSGLSHALAPGDDRASVSMRDRRRSQARWRCRVPASRSSARPGPSRPARRRRRRVWP